MKNRYNKVPTETTRVEIKERIYNETRIVTQDELITLSTQNPTRQRFNITVSAGLTLQLRPYEFLRVDASIEMPIDPSYLDHALPTINNYLTHRLFTIAEDIKNKQQ